MSLILDALKKLDGEKKKADQRPMDIAVDILSHERESPKRRILVFSGVIALTIVIAATAAYVNLVVKKPVAVSPAVNQGPVNPDIGTYIGANIGADIAAPAKAIVNQAGPARPSSGPTTSGPDKAVDKAIGKPIDKAINKKQPSTESPKKKTASVEQADSPSLRQDMAISVIVWYEEPSERKAVINGIAVKEGEIFEGARVEHIYPSRIVFVKDGKSFERSMDK